MKSILRKEFRYTSAEDSRKPGYLKARFERIRAEQRRIAAEQVEKVAQIKARKK